jgi:hypothetical protein
MLSELCALLTMKNLWQSGTVHFAVKVFKDVTKKGVAITALVLDQAFTGAPHDMSQVR